jgi:hypothetical protein
LPDPGTGQRGHAKKRSIAIERNAEARAAWVDEQAMLVPDDPVFLDESSIQNTLTRTHGRAPHGQRLVAAMTRNPGPTITCLAALRTTGVGPPLVVEEAYIGDLFARWVRGYLVPTLRPRQVVILDSPSVHKRIEVRKAIEAAGLNAVTAADARACFRHAGYHVS